MGCSLRSSQAEETGAVGWLGASIAVLLVLTVTVASPARAQRNPVLVSATVNSDLSAGAALADLGSNFLERLGDQGTGGFGRAWRSNPGGGGASEAVDGPLFRTWGEAYGISTRTGPQLDFFGDRRQTLGGVAGIGVRTAPGVNVGFSIDQSRTAIDVPLALQSATLDLTQLGFSASIDRGPWTGAIALVHGFGNIHSMRDTGFGAATAGYAGQVDGALGEVSYYWNMDQSRIVPKAALEYVRSSTGSFQEAGGLDPVAATGASLERARILVGAEIGRYWIVDQKVVDLSAYGKLVDNFEQNFNSVTVSSGFQSITVQGVGESRYGVDTGASASLSLSSTVRLYLNYEGRFRAALQSHQGTAGFELRW
jgi:uncharacterized protein with beta-barrel porin domain